MLPVEVLDLLRQWWKVRPTRHDAGVAPEQRCLFPGRSQHRPLTTRQFSRLFKEAVKDGGLRKAPSLHALRQSFATHLLDHGPAWREANRGHVSLDQLKVMSAIERCRTAELGGHVARCENVACGHTEIAYNSCRNRHCPKCQAVASRQWLAGREAELLPVPYFHAVYTLPRQLRDITYQNKRVVYDLLMKAAAERTLAIAVDPKRLGARIGVTAVLHTGARRSPIIHTCT